MAIVLSAFSKHLLCGTSQVNEHTHIFLQFSSVVEHYQALVDHQLEWIMGYRPLFRKRTRRGYKNYLRFLV
jgi:hypothetical protein